jgi:hypothetical protein
MSELLFENVEELSDILDTIKKDYETCTVNLNCTGANDSFNIVLEKSSEKVTITFNLDMYDEDDDTNINYFIDNYQNFFKDIFEYVNTSKVKKLYLFTNDEDEYTTCIKPETFELLEGASLDEVYITFRGHFMDFEAESFMPESLRDILYVRATDAEWIKWQPDFYCEDPEDQEDKEKYILEKYGYDAML